MSEYDGREKLWKQEPVPDTVKAEIAGKLVGGEKPIDLADKYGVSLATISRIKTSNLSKELLAKMNDERQLILADLLGQSLTESIEANIRIMRVTRDESWLKSQKANDLGIMFGVVSDKFVKTMEAVEYANTIEDPEAQDINVE